MFTDFFVRRPVFASVCSLLIVLVGMVSFGRLPVREYPQIDPPVISISTTYAGANPKVVETEVTEIIEDGVNGAEGLKTLSSASRNSFSTITATFELDVDLDVAAQDVRDRVAEVRGELPDEAEPPVVRKQSGDSSPMLWMSLYGDRFSPLELTDYADRYLIDQLESVRGVSSVYIGGERRYSMRLWLDPSLLAARDLTVLDVEEALRRENVEIPSGRIEAKEAEFSVRTLGRMSEPEQYEELIVEQRPDGTQTLLRDLGYAEIGPESDRSFVRFNGKPAIALGIVKLSDANTISVSRLVRQRMAELSKDFPTGMSWKVAFDRAEFVQAAIDEVWSALFVACALVVLIIFVFLQDWRATLVPAVTIPVSLIGAFGIMYALDFSLNTLTLFALTLSTGLVVDDTIVVLENIVRYIQDKNLTPMQASFQGVGEVFFAVIATTAVLVAVFLPVAFAEGTTGKLFGEFALTMAGTAIISTFVALTLAPPLAARVLKQDGHLRSGIFRRFEAAIDRGRDRLGGWLAHFLRHRKPIYLGLAITLILSGVLFQAIPKAFLPTEDRGTVLTIVRAPDTAGLPYTSSVMSDVEEVFASVDGVDNYFSVGAFASGGGVGQVNSGIAFADLAPWGERRSQQSIIGMELFPKFSRIPEALVFPINISGLPGAGFGQPVQFVIQGENLGDLAKWSGKLVEASQDLKQVRNLDASLSLTQPELQIEIDRERARRLGVDVRTIARNLQLLLGGEDITTFNRGSKRYEVMVQAQQNLRDDPSVIEEIYVRTASGSMVPLANLVEVKLSTTPPKIPHFNRFRSSTISGSPAPGYSLGDALESLQEKADQILPEEYRTALSGESLEYKEAGQTVALVFGLSMIFIFLVLAAQFESYLDPFTIMLAVPLSVFGALLGIWLAGISLNVYSQVGIVMLIGLVTKNSILIVEFANQLRDRGYGPREAALEASKIRFRPILMTAFSTIFGLLPLAFAAGPGAASRSSLGMAVVGGMLVSTLLSLIVVPIFYVMAAKLRARVMPSS